MTRMSRSVPTVETSSTSGTGGTTVVSVGPSCVGGAWNLSPYLWLVRMNRTLATQRKSSDIFFKSSFATCVSVLWNVCFSSGHRKADQWDTRGPVRTWEPRSVPVFRSRRRRRRDGLQERQHQQPEQRYLHAGGEGRREDSLLSPLHGHTAEEAAEVGREGPRARYSETLRGKMKSTDFSLSLFFPPVVQSMLRFLFMLSWVYTVVSFPSFSVCPLRLPVVHLLKTCLPVRGWGCAWKRWMKGLQNTSEWQSLSSKPHKK